MDYTINPLSDIILLCISSDDDDGKRASTQWINFTSISTFVTPKCLKCNSICFEKYDILQNDYDCGISLVSKL
jgi:hypothetical protein